MQHMNCLAAGWAVILGSIAVSSPPARASSGCAADITGDHIADSDDMLALINAWGPCPGGSAPCPADVQANGIVNIDDMLQVLGAWGPCPCNAAGNCVSVSPVWCEDFQLLNYSRWTDGYAADNSCDPVNFDATKFISPTHSHRSRILCTTPDSHRSYGGLRFQGDAVLPNFGTPSTGGINAPNGVLVTMHVWLSSPYTFDSSKWISFLTVTSDCSNAWNNVLTLNIDDSSMKLKPVHITGGAYAPDAPAFPLQQWVRITSYINFYTGQMHVWQNGQKVCNATFTQPNTKMCQWHWGLYASAPNHDLVLHEDNISIVKLNAPLTNFTAEPWYIANGGLACIPAP